MPKLDVLRSDWKWSYDFFAKNKKAFLHFSHCNNWWPQKLKQNHKRSHLRFLHYNLSMLNKGIPGATRIFYHAVVQILFNVSQIIQNSTYCNNGEAKNRSRITQFLISIYSFPFFSIQYLSLILHQKRNSQNSWGHPNYLSRSRADPFNVFVVGRKLKNIKPVLITVCKVGILLGTILF